ncbi:putative lipid II flippase FtsW [bacterium]|nr:putative lipid II flippase FtsW [bacterium]
MKTKYSYYLLFLVIFLSVFGVIMVYSASALSTLSTKTSISSDILAKKQLIYVALGAVIFTITSFIDYKKYEKLTYPIYVGTTLLLLMLFVGFGKEVNGSVRWITIAGFRFQPSEFAKLAVIIYLAHSLSKKNITMLKQFYIGVFPHLVFTGIIMLLILAEPDFGSAFSIGVLLLAMMITAGVKWRDVLIPTTILGVASYFLIALSPYRAARFNAFLNPWEHRSTSGYQLVESLLAFASGGINGVGLGKSFQKRFYLPEAHTDFIASIIGEELGFIGITTIFICYILLFYIGLRIALKSNTLFGVYVAIGISILIFSQAMVNLGVVLGAFPTKGLTLPFISFGGSSIIVLMIMMGILFNISKNPLKDNELASVNYSEEHQEQSKKGKTVKKSTKNKKSIRKYV